MKTINIDGVEYVKKEDVKQELAKNNEGLEAVLIRTYSAGVHVGYLKEQNGMQVKLVNSKRVHYWKGACSCSEVAVNGMNDEVKAESRISLEVPEIELEAIEIIKMTEKAVKNIWGIKTWKYENL